MRIKRNLRIGPLPEPSIVKRGFTHFLSFLGGAQANAKQTAGDLLGFVSAFHIGKAGDLADVFLEVLRNDAFQDFRSALCFAPPYEPCVDFAEGRLRCRCVKDVMLLDKLRKRIRILRNPCAQRSSALWLDQPASPKGAMVSPQAPDSDPRQFGEQPIAQGDVLAVQEAHFKRELNEPRGQHCVV